MFGDFFNFNEPPLSERLLELPPLDKARTSSNSKSAATAAALASVTSATAAAFASTAAAFASAAVPFHGKCANKTLSS